MSELCETLTYEELLGWFAFAELEAEELRKEQDKIQKGSAIRGRRR